jgi:hypothetical protein
MEINKFPKSILNIIMAKGRKMWTQIDMQLGKYMGKYKGMYITYLDGNLLFYNFNHLGWLVGK